MLIVSVIISLPDSSRNIDRFFTCTLAARARPRNIARTSARPQASVSQTSSRLLRQAPNLQQGEFCGQKVNHLSGLRGGIWPAACAHVAVVAVLPLRAPSPRRRVRASLLRGYGRGYGINLSKKAQLSDDSVNPRPRRQAPRPPRRSRAEVCSRTARATVAARRAPSASVARAARLCSPPHSACPLLPTRWRTWQCE